MANRHSIVHWFPDLEKHKCGYCKQLTTNVSHGMWAESLTVEDYQNLIDRGWRRSGKYCYKPVMDQTCCPLYTIRCEALNFKPTKSQKKILKRVNKFLSDPEQESSHDNSEASNEGETSEEVFVIEKPNKMIDINKINNINFKLSNEAIDENIATNSKINIQVKGDLKEMKMEENDVNIPKNQMKNSEKNVRTNSVVSSSSSSIHKSGIGADPSKPPCKKAKLIRFERRQQKLAAKGISEAHTSLSLPNERKALEEFINDVPDNPIHRLRICLVETGSSRTRQQTRLEEYPIYKKYQMLVHNDLPERCTERQFTNFLFESPFQLELVQMSPEEPTFRLSHDLYRKYQIVIHNDPIDECDIVTYQEFLVDTPLQHYSPPDGPPSGYGSFHQQYWLGDKLIAVGVIDILPRCVSSVYFFYDPDYRHLTLGTYGSLREVGFTRELYKKVPDIKYYYMGFYIHSCSKMRYKANLAPSFLLCPETYEWFPIAKCILKLETLPYARLNDDIDAIDHNACNSNDVDGILVLINYRTCMPYKYFKRKMNNNEEEFILFGSLVGKMCVSKILLILRDSDF